MVNNFHHKNNTQTAQQCKSFLSIQPHQGWWQNWINPIHKMQFLTAMSKFMYIWHNFTDLQHILNHFVCLGFLTKLFAPNANFNQICKNWKSMSKNFLNALHINNSYILRNLHFQPNFFIQILLINFRSQSLLILEVSPVVHSSKILYSVKVE